MPSQQPLHHIFPKASHYDPDWVRKHSMGENVLFNLESLTKSLALKPGMRVLDLGCGKAISSIFLAKEFGVTVWAVDEAISASDNYQRICQAGCEAQVIPLEADARALPFAEEYFDAVIVVDSYTYFGTDEKYLPYIARFIKPEGYIAIVDVCFKEEIQTLEQVPSFLQEDYQNYWYFIHSIAWWRQLWEKTGLVEIEAAQELAEVELVREHYVQDSEQKEQADPFAKALAQDTQGFVTFFKLVGRRTKKTAYLQDYKVESKK
ncbi:methyltransferase family protein [Pontibacter ummariensis]|uniref:Methyltransferase domain-containing protein n=1 Tax=Pontibacter ummariensis TaxID=1610492 RepID=A0A239E0R5_9BACT|nr:methyltransferase domain-containing protein [Pontibacter ummariensis]PRY13683.1 methyltransferase family protein [Pontibacter ummariensis]SNS37583.1 Methyltransferase domain-containing protein [Pontibacter ummariensis]